MTTTLSPQTTVAEIVTERPSLSRLFEKLGIDYCCGGKLPLAEACAQKGLDAATVLATIEAAQSVQAEPGANPATMSLTELCDHIVQNHHEYLRQELPRLDFLTGKVANAHGENHPWVLDAARVFGAMQQELTQHMMKEERVLFPAIRDMEAGRPPQSPCGSHLEGPVTVMIQEHEMVGEALESLHTMSSGYTPPEDACNTFRAMLEALSELEMDLHEHIHKENNILFPRALEMSRG